MGFVLERPLPVTRRTRTAGVLVVVALVVAGVMVWRSTRPNLDPNTEAKTAAGVTVLLYAEQFEGDIAVADTVFPSYTLRVLPGRCLGFTGRGSALAVFPVDSDVVVRGGHVAVRVPTYSGSRHRRSGSVVLRPGDEVSPGWVVGPDPVSIRAFGGQLADHTPRSCQQYPAQDVDLPPSP